VNAIIRPRAREDIIRQFRWYLVERDASKSAFRFLEAVEKSVAHLLSMPHMGAPITLRNSTLEGLHSRRVEGFKDIRIYYLVQGAALKVVRVLHGKRDVVRVLESERADETRD
jgi:plasmid stabilization system protein ParE